MQPYQATCPFCGHVWLGYSRQLAWDYMLDHCNETPNHPIREPYLVRISVMLYWEWVRSADRGRIEQLLRHAVPDARKSLRNIPLA